MSSIGTRMACSYLIVTVLLFLTVMLILNSIINGMLLDQRVSEQSYKVQRMAQDASEIYDTANTAGLYAFAQQQSESIGGRVLLVDTAATVRADSQNQMNGSTLNVTELQRVLSGEQEIANGRHNIQREESSATEDVMYYAAPIYTQQQIAGGVLVSVSLQELQDRIVRINQIMLGMFALCSFIIFFIVFRLSNRITRPVARLSGIIEKFGKGEMDVRFEVTGRSEIDRLGETFNMMSDKLERLNKNRNEFVSDASHEMRTPLSTMKILIESLIYGDNADPEMTREFLTDINKEIDRLTSLINDLLLLVNMDRDTAEKQESLLQPLELEVVVSDVVKHLQPLAQRKNISCQFVERNAITVAGDSNKLYQAVYNLVDNAVKYTPEGGKVDVRLFVYNKQAKILVADTGIGIPAQDIPHVFERFFRVDKARSRVSGGTGLGLSIVQRIILLHGGRIDVESQEGMGTTVAVTLPLYHPPVADDDLLAD